MQIQTVLLIILAAVIALITAVFQYMYKKKSKSRLDLLFSFLRFSSVFVLLILLISPEVITSKSYIQKVHLPVLIDNSGSIRYLDQDHVAEELLSRIKTDNTLNEKYNITYYSFSDKISSLDTLSFTKKQTNITEALKQVSELQDQKEVPILLLSDGNQTYGFDYEFYAHNYPHTIYPVVLGDTAAFADVKIDNVNVNKYAYLKNTFPIEVLTSYEGKDPVSGILQLFNGNTLVHSERYAFSSENDSHVFDIQLLAQSIGVQQLTVVLTPFEGEKNRSNNTRRSAVEVIDQKTNIALISDIKHPDLGALKRAVSSNKQRTVDIIDVDDFNPDKEEYQLLILFNPTNKFEQVHQYVRNANKNVFTITGITTDWSYLNAKHTAFQREVTFDEEEVLPVYNDAFRSFNFEDIDFNDFPPLDASFGDLSVWGTLDVLLNTRIGNVITNTPLLATFEQNGKREAVLFGEGIWKWRSKSFRDYGSYEKFDKFIGGVVQYLSNTNDKDRLNLNYESFYYGNNKIVVSATYFDKNYIFDKTAQLQISLKETGESEELTFPLVLKNNCFEADLSSLTGGDYNFTITSVSDRISKSGKFTILNYNAEEQFTGANYTKLERVAGQTAGRVFLSSQIEALIKTLGESEKYKPVYKSEQTKTPLIQWYWLLVLLVTILAVEWFLRKYNGLI